MQAAPNRTVLVIDEDAAFRDRLASLLAPLGVRIDAVLGEDAVLETLGRRPPEAVVIAVDLPDKEGYALFSKVKKARRRVPVALVTSTISPADLKLHEKLKIHAEAYLDKRLATDDDLRDVLENRLGISSRTEAPPAAAEPALESDSEAERPLPQETRAATVPLEPWLAELLDPETLARNWAIPGTPGLEHRIGGLEKGDGHGNISYDPANHDYMVRTRQAKIDGIDVPDLQVDDPDRADTLVLGWGSTYGPITAAVRQLREDGEPIAQTHLRHLNPFPKNLGEVLARYEHVVVPEMNLGQLATLIRAKYLVDAHSYNQVNGMPFKAEQLATALKEAIDG